MLSRIHVIPHLKGKRTKARREAAGNHASLPHPTEGRRPRTAAAELRERPGPLPAPTRPEPAPPTPLMAEVVETGLVELPAAGKVKRKLVAVGASTGGPKALVQIFHRLPRSFPLPILTVQHIAPSFAAGLVNWLNRESPLNVILAEDKSRPEPGTVHVAPTGVHMVLERGLIRLSSNPPVNSCRPSVDVLFNSVAESVREFSLGVLLTGMGRDGAEGLKAIKNRRGWTMIQDEATSVIFGMPRAAQELGAMDEVVSLNDIPRAIARAIAK